MMESLLRCPLFAGLTAAEITAALPCLGAERRRFVRGAVLLRAGEPTARFGVVCAGRLSLLQDDYWGNRTLLAQAEPGELFGEVYACLPGTPLAVTVQAETDGEALLLRADRLAGGCENACAHHARLAQNLLAVLAEKNRNLAQKAEILSRRTTREKLLCYLSAQARRQGGGAFTIPLNRQQLADYLAVDRSAMSAALHRMAREGLLRVDRNHFEFLEELP